MIIRWVQIRHFEYILKLGLETLATKSAHFELVCHTEWMLHVVSIFG